MIKVAKNYVTQIKTKESDGYNAIQIGTCEKKKKRTTKALQGHFAKATTEPLRKLVEFKNFQQEFAKEGIKLGSVISVNEIFKEATLTRPADGWMQKGGKDGLHSEHLGFILAEMQWMQRAYPAMEW